MRLRTFSEWNLNEQTAVGRAYLPFVPRLSDRIGKIFGKNNIERAMRLRTFSERNLNEQTAVGRAYLPFVPRLSDRIGKIFGKNNIEMLFKPTTKVQDHLRLAKDSCCGSL